jgi:hypothetical protein
MDCLTPGCTRNQDGIKDLTNNLMTQAGNKTFTVNFLNYNDQATFGVRGRPRTAVRRRPLQLHPLHPRHRREQRLSRIRAERE